MINRGAPAAYPPQGEMLGTPRDMRHAWRDSMQSADPEDHQPPGRRLSIADAGRPIEHPGNVLEQLEPAVERAALDQVEGDVGIPVEDAVLPGGTGDDWENDHT